MKKSFKFVLVFILMPLAIVYAGISDNGKNIIDGMLNGIDR